MKFFKKHWNDVKIPLLFLAIGIVIGGVVIFCLRSFLEGTSCTNPSFQYINPRLGCDTAILDKRGYEELDTQLQNFIKNETDSGDLTTVSMYFRDLQNGPTLGINEHENFAPASLLKLPMLLTYLSYGESHPEILNTKLEYDNYDDSLDQSIVPEKSIQPNTPYSIKDMLTYMIAYSDNRSYYALFNYLYQFSPNIDLLKDTYTRLGIIDPQGPFDQTIEVKQYSSIFLQLYNPSFFENKETSEYALKLLTLSTFDKGIVAGIPKGTTVAHKFGERTDFSDGIKQLHDCGIVYYPHNPYLICIMTRGTNFSKLEEAISTISKMVYQEFDSRRL